jgi:hypothetical protein
MAQNFNSIADIADVIGDGGPHNPDTHYQTVGQVVDHLVNIGNTPEVYAHHDDHLGLKSDLSEKFLNSPLEDAGNPEFAEQTELVLEQAGIIIPLLERSIRCG